MPVNWGLYRHYLYVCWNLITVVQYHYVFSRQIPYSLDAIRHLILLFGISSYICVYVCMYICIYICIYVCICVYVYIYMYVVARGSILCHFLLAYILPKLDKIAIFLPVPWTIIRKNIYPWAVCMCICIRIYSVNVYMSVYILCICMLCMCMYISVYICIYILCICVYVYVYVYVCNMYNYFSVKLISNLRLRVVIHLA